MAILMQRLARLGLLLALATSQRGLGAAGGLDGFMNKPASFAPAAVTTPEATPAPKKRAQPVATPAPTALVLSPAAAAAPEPAWEQRLQALEKASKPSAFKLEGFAALRFDHQNDVVLGYGAVGSDQPKAKLGQALGSTATASRGAVHTAYLRRAELKLTHDPLPWAKFILGWDLSENKVKDVGLELSHGKALKLMLGQARLRFGHEPQVSSSRTWFAERALAYGGSHPFTSGPSALVRERAMGLHADARGALGAVRGGLGLSLVNNATEDQAVGQNKPGSTSAFPASISDHSLSCALRGGGGFESKVLKAALGVSYLRDPQDTRPQAELPSHQRLEETWGLDAQAQLPLGLSLSAEWLAKLRLSGNALGWQGVDSRREAWYASAALDLLRPWLGPQAPSLELLGRVEAWTATYPSANPYAFGARTLGLRWAPLKGWHSAVNYTVYDLAGDASALGGSELLVFQQQMAF